MKYCALLNSQYIIRHTLFLISYSLYLANISFTLYMYLKIMIHLINIYTMSIIGYSSMKHILYFGTIYNEQNSKI